MKYKTVNLDEDLAEVVGAESAIMNPNFDRVAAAAAISAGEWTPAITTIPDVPILEAGVEYSLSTGPTTFTPEDLRDCVTAANEDPAIPAPRAKMAGHTDPRYNKPPYDGSAAFGKYVNLRLGDNGMVVYADWVGCPKWLADIAPYAFPSRSIEGHFNIESQTGRKWKFVLSAVASLGVYWPGVTVLEDLPLYFGEEMPDDVVVTAAAATGGDPMASTAASANLDDVRRAFYNQYRDDNAEAYWWWVRAVLTDPNQLVVEDDEDGQLYLMDFASDAKGNVTFGEPNPVRIDYVPDEREAKKAAAGMVAASLLAGQAAAGRTVLASYENREESGAPPTTASEGGAMDPVKIRQRLGLAATATDEEVQAALSELAGAMGEAPATPAAAAPAPAPVAPVAPVAPAPVAPAPVATAPEATPAPGIVTTAQLEAAEAAAAAATPPPATPGGVLTPALIPGATGKPMVQVDSEVWAAMQASVKRGEEAWARVMDNERKQLLDDAMAAGKFPPSRREAWDTYFKQDPDGAKAALAELIPGLVPTTEIGGAGADETHQGPAYPVGLFPEIEKRRNREAAVASGLARPGRVSTDGSIRRGSL